MADIDISKYLERFRRDTIYIKSKSVSQENSMGAILDNQSSEETPIQCNVQPGGGRLLVAEYGERAVNMLAVFADPDVSVKQGDLVRVYAADKPDYRVVAAPAWKSYTRIDLEKM